MFLCMEELKKILRCRSSWFVVLAILVIQVVTVVSGYKDMESKCGNIAAYNAYADSYNGTLNRELVDSDDIQKMKKGSYQRAGNTVEDYFYERYLAAIVNADEYKAKYQDGNEPKYWNAVGINNLVQNLTTSVSACLVFIGLIFGLHPIFLKDTENGMDKIIYSSYDGRKQILKAKCIAAMAYEAAWVTIYYVSIAFLTIVVFRNTSALNIPVNFIPCLSFCTVHIRVWQYLWISYFLLLMASTFVTAFMVMVYAKVKRIMAGWAIGIALTFIPMFVPKNGNVGRFFCILPSVFSNASLIVAENLKLKCMGTEISILGLGTILLAVGTVLVFLLLRKIFWIGRVE